MVRFIIVRHGYSETNKTQTFAGQLDVDLDSIGYEQAEDVKECIINNYKIDAIYSSDLRRAINTAKPTAEALGMEIKTDVDLREMYVGEWQGMAVTDVAKKYPETFSVYKTNVGEARPDGGENYTELSNRADAAFRRIAKGNEGKTVMVVTHGGLIRALRCRWNGLCMTTAQSIPHVPNASLTVVDYDNGKFRFKEVAMADHLRSLSTEKDIKQLF